MTPQSPNHLGIKTAEVSLRPNGLLYVVWNRPKSLNSITEEVYQETKHLLDWAAESSSVNSVLITAQGRLFSSGRDMSIKAVEEIAAGREPTGGGGTHARDMVDALINFPKLLIAGVNGPAHGIGVTMLGLFDLVYAAPDSTFRTPFSTLGLSVEGCSSYTFPRLMGRTTAARLLYLSETLSAKELVPCGFIAEIIPSKSKDDVDFRKKLLELVEKKLHGLSFSSIAASKSMIRTNSWKQNLSEINKQEFEVLRKNYRDPYRLKAMSDYLENRRKANSKKGKL